MSVRAATPACYPPPTPPSKDRVRVVRPSPAIALPRAFQRLGDLESQLERLGRIQPRVTMRQIAVGERSFADRLRAADAFGDVLSGELEMDAAGIASLGGMDCEGAMQLVENAIERTGLVPVRGGDGVAVHRIAAPHDLATLALDGA